MSPTALTPVPRFVRVSGSYHPADGLPAAAVETVTLAVYPDQQGGDPLWEETHSVAVGPGGRYDVLMGSTSQDGLPLDLFTTGEPRWLGVRFNRAGEVEQARGYLVSVPYALKAVDAETLGGRPASAYVLAEPSSSSETQAVTGRPPEALGPPTQTPLTAGTPGYLGMFTNATDLGNSVMYENSGRVGVNTTTPLDVMHARFTDTSGAFTGYAVQNLGSGAASYSGMLFYDQNGVLGQFQGFNNATHEYRINNIASGGSINFMIGSSSKFLVANNGNVTVNGNLGAKKVSAQGNGSFVASGTVTVSSASSTVTGTGTAFLTELQVGDRLLVGANSRPVTAIASNTSLTVSSAFPADASGAATVFPSILRLVDSSGATQVLVNDLGNMQLGSVFSATPKLMVYQANRFVGTSTNSSYSSGNLTVATSGTAGMDLGGVIALGGIRGTTAGGALFAGLRGAKENGTDDDVRGYLGLYTTDIGNTFAERARLSSSGNLGVGTNNPGQKIEVNGGIRLNTVTVKPTCDATVRGTVWVTQLGLGVEDSVEVCVKNAADAFVWRTVF